MQRQGRPGQRRVGKGLLGGRGVEEDQRTVIGGVKVVCPAVGDAHHDQAGDLLRAGVEEAHARLTAAPVCSRNRGTLADSQHLLKVRYRQ